MRYKLETVVFLSGFNVMALELVGSRILAPFLGSSIFVWTSLIGVILASLSLGYWRGGIAADKNPTYKKLASILYLAGIFIGITAVANTIILLPISISGFGPRWGSVIAALFLFAPAAMLFGMVSPLAAKMKINDLNNAGKNVGSLYALSTLGSIAGTFAGGFYLISFFGSELTLAFIAFLTVLTAFIANPKLKNIINRSVPAILILFAIFYVVKIKANTPNFKDLDTEYKRIWIVDNAEPSTGRMMRLLIDAPNTSESSMYLDNQTELAASYTKYFDLYKFFSENSDRVLMLGGGAFSYPKYFLADNQAGQIDVIEIDTGLTKIAENYFGLKPDPRMTIINQDARVFLNNTEKKYDTVFVDVFASQLSIPYHVITKEAIEKEYELLNDGGAMIVNIIGVIDGVRGKYFRAALATFKSVFPQVYVFPVRGSGYENYIQNIVLVALKSGTPHALTSNDPKIQNLLSHLWTKDIPQDTVVYTDDFAPVERYAEEMLE